MFTLALIGLLGGLITGISPCILPVLPVIFFSGGAQSARRAPSSTPKSSTDADGAATASAAGGTATLERTETDAAPAPKPVSRWRPYIVILGLVTSFSLFTLVGSLILALLGLPQDVLRWAGIVVLVLIGIGLIFPAFQHILEKPFSWIPQRQVGTQGGGFLLGMALGAVYVPCAGPVLAAITVAGSTGQIGVDTVVLTVTFAIGAALPLLIFALAGRSVAERVKAFRTREVLIRRIGGIVMIALAVGIAFNLPQALQRLIPDYTASFQDQLANSDEVVQALNLGGLVNDQNKDLDQCSNGAPELESCGIAPDIKGIQQWFNTPDDQPIALDDLRGEVVLVDFWAYSCINCQRSIPHVVAWDEAYRDAGLRVIGVHSPEYAFEKEPRNVVAGAQNFGIEYPVALDNSLSTWTNYRNRYWPAHYLIDADGVVRHIKFGEGGYETTEQLIRELLEDADPGVQLPEPTDIADSTPTERTTPETYLSPFKAVNYGGEKRLGSGEHDYTYPADQQADTFALSGTFDATSQYLEPVGGDASIRLEYTASEVRMVLAGEGSVTAVVDGETRTFDVSGTPNSYPILERDASGTGEIEVTFGPGVQAYSFTFG